MDPVNTPILARELEPLKAQIEEARARLESFEEQVRIAETELEKHAADGERFDALRDICAALDKLSELDADELFWEHLPAVSDRSACVGKLRERVSGFEEQIRSLEENRRDLQERIEQCLDELDILDEEVRDAHAREERRQEEFVIEREVSPIPYRRILMPWTTDGEAERQLRRSVLVALVLCIVFGSLIPLVNIPLPDRTETAVEIPERMAMLVKKQPPRPEPVVMPERQDKKDEPEKDKEKPTRKKSSEKKAQSEKKTKVAARKDSRKAARQKAQSTGVLAFKDTFKDLMDETPAAKLGTEARIKKKASSAPGNAKPQRSLVSSQAAAGSSGGISDAAVSRNIGNGGDGNADRIGGVGFSRVESAVAGLSEQEGRPVSDGPGPARTDEEIQIVFDRYKATLYRIYNKALRKDPTLRGKLLLKITIEPQGQVSFCEVESTDLGSDALVAKIVARVERFNFGPKESVPPTTILYPIDFLPAG